MYDPNNGCYAGQTKDWGKPLDLRGGRGTARMANFKNLDFMSFELYSQTTLKKVNLENSQNL